MRDRLRRMSTGWLMIAVLLGAWADAASLRAQECPCCCHESWLLTTPQLTGDWLGNRSYLADNGITLDADNTGFYFGNVAGGINQDFDYSGHGDYVMNVDAGKLGLQEGLFVKLRAEHRYGLTLVNDVGMFLSPTVLSDLPVYGSDQLYLTNVLFTQMLSESFGVFAGKLDTLDGDMNAFAHARGKTQFSNMGFVFNPVTAETVPYSTLGAGFLIMQDSQPIFLFNVLNSQDTTNTSGFSQLFNDGVLIATSIRLPTNFLGFPGHQLLGGTWNSRTYNSIGDAYLQYPNLVIPTTSNSWSLFWNFDQYLVTDSLDPLHGWGVFGRAGIADPNTNPLSWFLSFGIGGDSPLCGRPKDTFGVGWYCAGSSSQIGPVLTAVFGPIGNAQGVECFYNYQLTPAIRLTPDLQVVVPSRETVDPSLLIGLRTQLIF